MLPDYLAPNLLVLFCGTAAGPTSAARGQYYAGPGNRFWQLLAETELTPRRLQPQDDALMPRFGLGLTDLAKGVSGMDRNIPPAAYLPARLGKVIELWRPKAVAFTSLTAARLALGDKRIGAGKAPVSAFPGTDLWVLPSPSGAARRAFRVEPWQDLATWVRWMRGGQR